MSDPYIGHNSQLFGVEEHRLVGGKGDGMRLFEVKNGKGLELTIMADRCADLARVSFKGDNYGYFSSCGYVAPVYYDHKGDGFLKSFTAGFMTTCGLTNTGIPCEDEGEKYPLHGNISHIPADHIYDTMDEDNIYIHATIRDEAIFARKLVMNRVIACSKKDNTFYVKDVVTNEGDTAQPICILYHINIGYPLLSEEAKVYIPSKAVTPRTAWAAEGIKDFDKIIPPQKNYEEQCYYHEFDKEGLAAVYNPRIKKGIKISFDVQELDTFTEWKMMGYKDYVLGLEPGNGKLEGRDVLRKNKELKILEPGESFTYQVNFKALENKEDYDETIKN